MTYVALSLLIVHLAALSSGSEGRSQREESYTFSSSSSPGTGTAATEDDLTSLNTTEEELPRDEPNNNIRDATEGILYGSEEDSLSKKLNESEGESTAIPTPYPLTEGPLSCEKANTIAVKKKSGTCSYEFRPGSPVPDILCQLIAAQNPVKDTYTTLIHNAATYSLWSGAGSRTDDGQPCVYQTRYLMRKVDRRPPGVPLSEQEAVLDIVSAQAPAGGGPSRVEAQNTLMSQGFKEIQFDLRPDALGPKGVLRSNYSCALLAPNASDCEIDLHIIPYRRETSLITLFVNRAWRLSMEFNPAYIGVASFFLDQLKTGALLEELRVTGGESWGDPPRLTPFLPRLRRLDLASNGLANLRPDVFVNLPHLLELKLSRNNFSTIPSGISAVRDLRVLDMAENPLTAAAMFQPLLPLTLLEVLNLSRSPLRSFSQLVPPSDDREGAIRGSRLLILDLSWCNISDASGAAAARFFVKYSSLRAVRLSGNPLHSLPPDLFRPLRDLRELRLAATGLDSPPALTLAPAVAVLDLSLNGLASPAGLFRDGSVEELDLSGNPFRPWTDEGAFQNVRALNLSRAALISFTPAMLKSLQHLRSIDFGLNPFDCNSCDLPYLQTWLQKASDSGYPEIQMLGERVTDLHCVHPSHKRSLPIRQAPPPPSDRCGHAALISSLVVSAVVIVAAVALFVFRFRLELTYVAHVIRANRSVRAAATASASAAPVADFDAFVCYSKHDRSWVVGELLPMLEGGERRYRLCLHERDFPLGSLILQNIVECMERSRHTIIVLTKAFVESQWCQWELEMATHRLLEGGRGDGGGASRDFLILVELERLETRALPRLLRLLAETRTFLEWPAAGAPEARTQHAWKRLFAALGPPLKPALEPPVANASAVAIGTANGFHKALPTQGNAPAQNGATPAEKDAETALAVSGDGVWFTKESRDVM